MSKIKIKFLGNILAILILGYFLIIPAIAQDSSDSTSDNQQKLVEIQKEQLKVQQELNKLTAQKKTLKNQIATINSQIQLTALKIRTTEGKIAETQRQINQLLSEIKDLTIKISELEDLLAGLSETLTNRIRLTYINELASPLDLFLSTDGFNTAVTRLRYLTFVQQNDKKLLYQTQSTRSNFRRQKDTLEEKERQVEALKAQHESNKAELVDQKLAQTRQKQEQEQFLSITQNDEKKFQGLLAQLQADADSIAKALGAVGAKIGPVSRGEVIGSVGSSGCSTGPHLHFEVWQNAKVENGQVIGNRVDPKPYLDSSQLNKPLDSYNGLGWSEGGNVTTWYGEVYFLGVHTGIDMAAPFGTPIHASDSGEAYLVSAPCIYNISGGTPLGKGILVDHKNGIVTLYWHIP